MSPITVSVPATTANLGPGFDCLGMALNLRNEFKFTPRPEGLTIEVHGEGVDSIPADANNLAVQAMQFLCDYLEKPFPACHIEQTNHVPAASGLGSSSTATVAGLLGANALLGSPVGNDCILKLANRMEGHPDNIAPAIFGGMVLAPMGDDGEVLTVERIEMPVMRVALVLPDFELLTSEARAALPTTIDRADAIFNMARVPLVLRALESLNYQLLSIAMQDRIHQPYRMALVPGMRDAFDAALAAGAACGCHQRSRAVYHRIFGRQSCSYRAGYARCLCGGRAQRPAMDFGDGQSWQYCVLRLLQVCGESGA